MTTHNAGAVEPPFIRGAILGIGPAPLLAHVEGIRESLRPSAERHVRALAQLPGGAAKALARAERRLAEARATEHSGDASEVVLTPRRGTCARHSRARRGRETVRRMKRRRDALTPRQRLFVVDAMAYPRRFVDEMSGAHLHDLLLQPSDHS